MNSIDFAYHPIGFVQAYHPRVLCGVVSEKTEEWTQSEWQTGTICGIYSRESHSSVGTSPHTGLCPQFSRVFQTAFVSGNLCARLHISEPLDQFVGLTGRWMMPSVRGVPKMPDRDTEAILKKVREYLGGLGYSSQAITSDAPIEPSGKVDFVVYSKGKPWGVVNTKESDRFPNTGNAERLRYDPYVRRIQAIANSFKMHHTIFSLTVKFSYGLPLDTSGRPQCLRDSSFSSNRTRCSLLLRLKISSLHYTFRSLRDFFRQNSVWGPRKDEVGVLILAKLLSEKGDDLLLHDFGLPNYGSLHSGRSRVWSRYLFRSRSMLKESISTRPMRLSMILD